LRKLADTVDAAAGMVNVSGLLPPLVAPLHATNVLAAPAVAVRLIDAPLMYEPAAHPTEARGERDTLLPLIAPVTV